MDPRFKTSFIPKKPMGGQGGPSVRRVDAISFLVYLIFIAALLASGATFGYTWWIERAIADAKEQVVAAREQIDYKLLDELSVLDRRLKAVGTIMQGHVAVVPLFELLEDRTVVDVRYDSFEFTSAIGGAAAKLVLNGEARDLSALASQSLAMDSTAEISSPRITELDQDREKNVTFKLETGLGAELLRYKAPK